MDEHRPPKIPELGTPEARERIRKSGVPLDEWVDMSSPSWRAEQGAKERAQRRFKGGIGCVARAGDLWWPRHRSRVNQLSRPTKGE
jgi:hypothetical protein